MRIASFATSTSLLALALSVGGGSSTAYAACTIDGMAMNEASNPESGKTINCEGNLDSDGVVNSDADDVTVNILAPSGGISVTGQAGVRLGDGATIDVTGDSNRPINTSGDNAPGIEVGDDATITVGGQVTSSGENSGAIRTGEAAEITIDGTVRTGGGMSDAISVGAESTVTLNDGALATTGNSNSDAIVLRGDGGTLTINNGAQVTTSSGMSNPLQVDGNMATIDVAGDVRSSSGDATAILIAGDDAALTLFDGGFVTAQSSNSNAIEVTGTGAEIALERGSEVRISAGNSAGIVTGADATLTVAGEISASSSQSQGVVLGDGSELTVQELGVISTSSSGSQAVLIAEDASSVTITVEAGGEIDAVGAQAIVDEGMTDTTITVSGTVFGGSSQASLDLGGGDDAVTIESGGLIEASSANPALDFGAGADQLTINAADGLTGPGMLADFGEGEDTLDINAGDFRSSQFSNVETVNVAGSGGSGASDDGGDMEETAAARSVSNRAKPALLLRMEAEDGAPSYTVDNDSSAQTVNVSGNATANVQDGGRLGESRASDGGRVTVENGGDGGRVQSDADGRVDVQSGGRARVDSGSGNGGEINFEDGSTADVDGEASARTQNTQIAGATFSDGSAVNVRNSVFLSGSASGDTLSVGLEDGAFTDGVSGQGVTNANLLAAARGVDNIAQAGTDEASLDNLGRIVLTGEDEVADTFAAIAREDAVQTAAVSVLTAQGFTDTLRAGVFPLVDVNDRGVGVWIGVSGQRVDIDANDRSELESNSLTYAGGLEADFGLPGLDEGRAGIAVGYTQGDGNRPGFDADVDSWNVGVYGGGTAGLGRVDIAASYSRADLETAGVDESADIFSGRAELGLDVLGDANLGLNVQPFVRLSGTTASFSDFDADGPLETRFDGQGFTQGVAGVGLRIGDTDVGNTLSPGIIRVSAEGGYERVFGDRDVAFDADLGDTDDAFTVRQRVADKNRFAAGAQIGLVAGSGLGVALRYDGRYGSDVTDHRGSIRISTRF